MDEKEFKKMQAEGEKEKRARNERKYSLQIHKLIPNTYLNATITDGKCREWLNTYFTAIQKPNLIIFGNYGTGKTWNMYALCHELFLHGIECDFGTMSHFLKRIRSTYNDDASYTEEEVMNKLTRIPVLFIDDLGKEKVSDWASEYVYDIFDIRRAHNLPVVCSSNLRKEDLAVKYGANGGAIASRLFGGAVTTKMSGKDKRDVSKR